MRQKIRKPNRLPEFDYGQQGAYYITVCTKNHRNMFWVDVHTFELSEAGKIVETAICQIPDYYRNVHLEQYVVMPNHIHVLLLIDGDGEKSISTIIGSMKRWATKQIGRSVWQKGFYDHVIRDEQDFLTKWNYIYTNPYRWLEDDFYFEI